MPKCNDCGQTTAFIHRLVETEVVYYEDGQSIDAKSLEVESSEIIACYGCDSTNIEEEQ